MKKIIYAGLLIGLTTAATDGFAATPTKETLTASKNNLSTAIAGVKSSFGGLFSGVFANVQQMVTDMNTIATSVNTTSESVENELPNEYAAIQTATSGLVTQLGTFQKTDCYDGSIVCNTSAAGVPDLLKGLTAATATYEEAVANLPTQTELAGGVSTIQKAIDGLDATDKATLNNLSTEITKTQSDYQNAMNGIDVILNKIESASAPS